MNWRIGELVVSFFWCHEQVIHSKCHCNAHFALLLPQLLFLDSCHVFVVYFAGSKLENQAGLYQARIHQALSRIGTISGSALKISNGVPKGQWISETNLP